MPTVDRRSQKARALWREGRARHPHVLAPRSSCFRTVRASLGAVEWKTARLTVHRAKGSLDSTHPLGGSELRELRALHRAQEPGCRFIFMTELRAPMTPAGLRKTAPRGVDYSLVRAKKLPRAAECHVYSLTPSGVLAENHPKNRGFGGILRGQKCLKGGQKCLRRRFRFQFDRPR